MYTASNRVAPMETDNHWLAVEDALARNMGAGSFDGELSANMNDTAAVSAERIQMEQEDQARYGDLLADVTFLRSRDFTVVLDGVDDDGFPTLLCDEKPITADGLRAKAARERRLIAEPKEHVL